MLRFCLNASGLAEQRRYFSGPQLSPIRIRPDLQKSPDQQNKFFGRPYAMPTAFRKSLYHKPLNLIWLCDSGPNGAPVFPITLYVVQHST